MGTAVQGDLLKGVGVEVGCEGFGSVERKERSYRQEIEANVACSEAEKGELAWQTNGHLFVRNRQSWLVVELQSGPSMGVRATLPVLDPAV